MDINDLLKHTILTILMQENTKYKEIEEHPDYLFFNFIKYIELFSKNLLNLNKMTTSQIEKVHKMLVLGAAFSESIKEVLNDKDINNIKNENKQKLKNFLSFQDNIFDHYLKQINKDNIATAMVIRDLSSMDKFGELFKNLSAFEFNLLAEIYKKVNYALENREYTINIQDTIETYDGIEAKYFIVENVKNFTLPINFEFFSNRGALVEFKYNAESTGKSVFYFEDNSSIAMDEFPNTDALLFGKEVSEYMVWLSANKQAKKND